MTTDNCPVKKYDTPLISVLVIAISVFAVCSHYSPSAAGTDPAAVQMVPASFAQLARAASPAVVNIRIVSTMQNKESVFHHFFKGPEGDTDSFEKFFEKYFNDTPPKEYEQDSIGSGFILDKDGYIVTNNHVIENADKIQVILTDGKEFDAEIIGTDATTDLALIKIKSDRELPVLKLGDSEKLDIGQWVIAIGNPFGLDHTVTAGIVSAKGRVIGAGPYDDFIQTDASINPGNSGGPLINMDGEVVGINSAIMAGGDGIGFAIPINMANKIIRQLKQAGKVTRGWLGVGIQDLDKDLKAYYGVESGVLITEVFEKQPADKAGIKAKDIILSIHGTDVHSSRELSALVAGLIVGDETGIKLLRNGKTRTVTAVIGKREDDRISGLNRNHNPQATDDLGIQVASISPEIAKELGIRETDGVMVVKTEPGGKGENAGIEKGDIIKEINHSPIQTTDDYHQALGKIQSGDIIQIYIKKAFKGYIVVKIKK